jgi:hypothetical protein
MSFNAPSLSHLPPVDECTNTLVCLIPDSGPHCLASFKRQDKKIKILPWIPEIFTYMYQEIPNIEHEINWTHNQIISH